MTAAIMNHVTHVKVLSFSLFGWLLKPPPLHSVCCSCLSFITYDIKMINYSPGVGASPIGEETSVCCLKTTPASVTVAVAVILMALD